MNLPDDTAVEALLKKADPRPVPSELDTERVRKAIAGEWQQMTGRRRRRQMLSRLAVAASVTLAVFAVLNSLQTGGIAPQPVASIDRQFGLVRVLGENAQFTDGTNLATVVTGQILDTGDNTGAALSWGTGGQLRIDANTRLEFVSRTEIRLHWGRIYYDSAPALSDSRNARPGELVIDTESGRVLHVGTRYMTEFADQSLAVSVRDGQVNVTSNSGRSTTVDARTRLSLSGDGAVAVMNFSAYGAAWSWTESLTPEILLDGRTVSEFLYWASQETGLQLVFESAAAETTAEQERLNGRLTVGPREALDIWLLATDLVWRVDNEAGAIYVDTN